MREHGHGLGGRTVARGRHRQSVELRPGRRKGRGLRGARVQARLVSVNQAPSVHIWSTALTELKAVDHVTF